MPNFLLRLHFLNNIRMLFDGNVILGGYIGPYIEEYMEAIKEYGITKYHRLSYKPIQEILIKDVYKLSLLC